MNNLLAFDLDFILAHTASIWQELSNTRIFITGGTGFFGKWLLESFVWINKKLNLNASAVVLTRNPDNFRKNLPHIANDTAIYLFKGDIRNFQFPRGTFSHIIHAATEANAKLNAENPVLMHQTIVDGAKRVLEFADICNAEKLLFISSGAIYGIQSPVVAHISENSRSNVFQTLPISSYGLGKKESENLFINAAKFGKFEAKIARCFTFVGPYLPLDLHFAVGNFILSGLKNESIIIKGNGKSYRSYLYIADLIIWLWHILFRGENCRPYNVGSEDEINIMDLANIVANCFSSKPDICVTKTLSGGELFSHYVPSTKRAREELGLRQRFGLVEAIKKTIMWYYEEMK